MFHAPTFGRMRDGEYASTEEDGNNGAFRLPSPEPGWDLLLIVSDQPLPGGDPVAWEHVSVHPADKRGRMRAPTWKEMCHVKDLCWDPEDVVMQLHPRASQYVNVHPHTLHLWRPVGVEIPLPPILMV